MRAKVVFDKVNFNLSIGGSFTSQQCDFIWFYSSKWDARNFSYKIHDPYFSHQFISVNHNSLKLDKDLIAKIGLAMF
jgi:hypothetical protein